MAQRTDLVAPRRLKPHTTNGIASAGKSAKNAKAQSTNRVLEKPLHQPNGKLAKGHVKLGGMQAGTPV